MATSPTQIAAPGTARERERRRAEAGRHVREALLRGDALTRAIVEPIDDDGLDDLAHAIGAVRQDADRMMAVVAAAQADRSRAKPKDVGYARRRGHRDVPGMLEKQGGVSGPEARRLIELGETLADAERARDAGVAGSASQSPSGPVFARVADAVSRGQMGAEAATAITRMLRRVAERCDAAELESAEEDLVFSARHVRLDRLRQKINRYEARLDAAHLEELAEARRQRRFLHIGENTDGMIRLHGQLDPENGAPLIAVMDAMVNQHFRLRKRAQDAQRAGEAVEVDERTPEQVRADAMGDFARHLAGCDVDILPHAGVKVVMRMDYESLRDKAASMGAIDGLSTTPDAGELRRLLARAGVIPQVLGGGSCTLDFGHERRPFTQSQRLALLARDGGCAKCGAPPSWCDAHHIVPLEFGGRTDLANGVMLCVRCHHDVHRDGWVIKATATEVWFTPPAHLDPHRKDQPGGRRLFDALPFPPSPPAREEILSETPMAATLAGDARRRGPTPCCRDPLPSVSSPVMSDTPLDPGAIDEAGQPERPRDRSCRATGAKKGRHPWQDGRDEATATNRLKNLRGDRDRCAGHHHRGPRVIRVQARVLVASSALAHTPP